MEYITKETAIKAIQGLCIEENTPQMIWSTDAMGAVRNAPDGWISVKDRLPEKDGMYLCLTMFKNKLNYQITLWGGKHWFYGYDVCYWMPLPEPPKEEEQNA